MKVAFVVDGASPTAVNWIDQVASCGHEVHIISTRSMQSEGVVRQALRSWLATHPALEAAPAIRAHRHNSAGGRADLRAARLLLRRFYPHLYRARLHVWPWPEERQVDRVRDTLTSIAPDLVHAMRIPNEGVLASLAVRDEPLLLSVWGNDFTLHAAAGYRMARMTRFALARADALHCDCRRDVELASGHGFSLSKPWIVLPGSGGIDGGLFAPGDASPELQRQLDLPARSRVVISPRGFRAYIRHDVLFKAIPLVRQQHPDVVFLCSGMAGEPLAEQWIRKYRIRDSVRLLPLVKHDQMPAYFRLADIMVSPSIHDGTPNTLLESMACGCFPVAGDIASVREWVTHGRNGLLFDPTDSDAVAGAIIRGLDDPDLRGRAREVNREVIAERAERSVVRPQIVDFYRNVAHVTRQTQCRAGITA